MTKTPDEAVQAAFEAYGDRYRSIAAMQDALTAAAPFLQGVKVKVKELEWTKGVVDMAQPHPGMKYVACSTTPNGSWAWWLDHEPETRAVFTSEEAAKAAAQADYEARISSAIEVSVNPGQLAPSPRAQALEGLPCDVRMPGVTLKRGVKFSVLLKALKRRESWADADRALSSQPVDTRPTGGSDD